MEYAIEIIKLISVLIGSFVAVFGITAWRRETLGKRKIELAEEILSLFYEIDDVFSEIRSPFGRVDEGKTRKTEKYESEKEKKARDNAFVIYERYTKHQETFAKFMMLRYRAMAVFGEEWGDPFVSVQMLLRKLFSSSRRLSELWSRDSRLMRDEAEAVRVKNQIEKYESIFWEGYGDTDPIREELQVIRVQLETKCRTEIEKGSSLVYRYFHSLS